MICDVFVPCTPSAGSEVQLFSEQRLLELPGEGDRGCSSLSAVGVRVSIPPSTVLRSHWLESSPVHAGRHTQL